MMNRLWKILIAGMSAAWLQPDVSPAFEPPAIPVGTWYTSSRTDPTYVRSVAQSLKEHHFNTIVGNGSFTKETIDIFQEQGIAVVTRGGASLDHPAVIGSVVGDAPEPEVDPGRDVARLKQLYQDIPAQPTKPLITCLVGDNLGVARTNDPWDVWQELKPAVRCFRWYGIARSHYGILHKRLYLGYLSLSSVLRIAGSGHGPYWVVLPGFGHDDPDAEHQNPSPAEIRGMMHLAVAYGARGILFWALQDYGGWKCLVAEESLKPTDGKYAAAGEVAATIQAQSELLRSLYPAGGDIRCPSSYVDAVGQVDGRGRHCMYAVNKNTKEPVATCLLWWGERGPLSAVRDLFRNEEIPVSKELNKEGYQVVPLVLGPGEARLLDFGGARPDEKAEEVPREATAAATGDEKAKSQEALARFLERSVSRTGAPERVRKFLGHWLGETTKWDEALLGGRLLMDGAITYEGGGKLVGAYESELGAFASWYASPKLGAAPSVKHVFATCGIAEQPKRMAILTLDVLPDDGKEHVYEVRIPMSPGLESVRRLACDLSPRVLESITGNAAAANKFQMRHFRYFEVYPRGNANYCADTVLRPAEKGAPGWLIARIIEPRRGPVFPAEYRKLDAPEPKATTLVLAGQGKEFRLTLLLFVDSAPADQEPRIYTVPNAPNELQLADDWYLKSRILNYGRTVFSLASPELSLAVGSEDDKTVEDEMVAPEDR